MCESTAAEAVDNMQRMDVARIRNGKRPTGGDGATVSPNPLTTTQRAAQSGQQGPQRDPHRKHTDSRVHPVGVSRLLITISTRPTKLFASFLLSYLRHFFDIFALLQVKGLRSQLIVARK